MRGSWWNEKKVLILHADYIQFQLSSAVPKVLADRRHTCCQGV